MYLPYTSDMLQSLRVGRETKARHLFNAFIAVSIFTVLGIRAFLAISGYPQLGGDSLHIAHMLWGGVMMLLSIVALLYYHGFRVKFFAAVLAAIGFGFFIDELGKFITKDNDYFYQPTAMLIYILFVLLWALFSKLAAYQPVTAQENAVDAFSKYRDAMIYGLSARDAHALKRQLRAAGCSKSEAEHLIRLANEIAPKYNLDAFWPKTNQRLKRVLATFDRIAIDIRTQHVLLVVFMLHVIISAYILISLAMGSTLIINMDSTPAFIFYGYALSVALYSMCFLVGAYYFVSRKTTSVFVWYRRALLINVFVTQIFLFYANQFQAAFGLAINIILLAFIDALVRWNEAKTREKAK